MNRCALLALCRGFWYIQATHTHTEVSESWLWSSGLGQVFILQPPQSPLSPTAMPVCSTLSSFLYPSFHFQIIFIILLLPGIHLPSLTFFTPNPFYHSNHQTFPSRLLCFLLSTPTSTLYLTSLSHIHPRATLFVSFQPSSSLSVEVQSPVAAAVECQTAIY